MKKFLLLIVFFSLPGAAFCGEMEKLDAILGESVAAYENVRDYEADFLKNEAEDGFLVKEPDRIFIKFEKPFKIYMEWLNSRRKGMQIVYERGKNDNKLVIHIPRFMFRLTPVLFLDQRSPWVREGSASYNIEDAGIGAFLSDLTKAVQQGKSEKKLRIDGFISSPEGALVDVVFTDTVKNPVYFAYRVRTFFDAHTKLPTKMELFDWQDRPMGVYFYENLRLNVGDNPAFKKRIYPKLYKIYTNH